MMKYSTYQSIFPMNIENLQETRKEGRARFMQIITHTLLLKLLIIMIVAWIAGAGVLTVFAAPSSFQGRSD